MEIPHIAIPERLKEKLRSDATWAANVTNVINNSVKIFLRDPKLFPEYTDHGVTHINHVLEISDKLIHDDTLEKMSAKTLGIYIISAILHDIGMFVTYEEFEKLISADCNYTKIPELDDRSLSEYWEIYLSELKRYSGKTLIRKFGTTDINFTELPDEGELVDKDILVIGEFLRQHHHKISQYIILNGLLDYDLLDNTGIGKDDTGRILIGITARSHGMNVRGTEKYLESIFGHMNTPAGTEVFYLMSVLRLADYLDAGEERASHIIEAMHVKYSEISKEEFKWNQSMRYEDFTWDNEKEYISINVLPENAEQFINVTKWLNSVQHELDLCWAIIGEKYGSGKCALTIRRVHSNIFEEQVIKRYENKFYTKEVSLNANADILALLIEPLYGNEPTYGVRELVQNATDACKERKAKSEGKEYDGKVSVVLDTKNKVFTITDNGIGMNIDTIVNYYLSAGASYRNSDVWKKDFSDSRGKSKVLRNGRFGVGVLATFLLGSTATVTTRHMNDERGWTFDIQLNQDNIEIKRIDAEIGTTVSVNLSDEVIYKLKNTELEIPDWNGWYFDDTPEVTYIMDNKRCNDTYSSESWHLLKQQEYKKYSWTYKYDMQGLDFNAVCNGIIIPSTFHFARSGKYRFNVYTPGIKIEDTEGKLPINLSRTELLELPCRKELYKECCKYVLAKLLTVDMSCFIENGHIDFTVIADRRYANKDFILSKDGYILCDAAFMKHSGMRFLNIFCASRYYRYEIEKANGNFPAAFRNFNGYDTYYGKERIRSFLSNGSMLGYGVYCDLNYVHMNSEARRYIGDITLAGGDSLSNNVRLTEDYYLWPSKHAVRKKAVNFIGSGYSAVVETEVTFRELRDDDIMLKVLEEYIPANTFIPYNLEERKKMFPKAFKELREYMED